MSNILNLNDAQFRVENENLFTLINEQWLKVDNNKYLLVNIANHRLLGLNGKVYDIGKNFQEIELTEFFRTAHATYLTSPQYGEEEDKRLVFSINVNGEVRLLGRTYVLIEEYLWKIGNLLYGRRKDGSIDILQRCKCFDRYHERIDVWEEDRDYSNLTVYEYVYGEWQAVKNIPYISMAEPPRRK